jgi:hypothetical protein
MRADKVTKVGMSQPPFRNHASRGEVLLGHHLLPDSLKCVLM